MSRPGVILGSLLALLCFAVLVVAIVINASDGSVRSPHPAFRDVVATGDFISFNGTQLVVNVGCDIVASPGSSPQRGLVTVAVDDAAFELQRGSAVRAAVSRSQFLRWAHEGDALALQRHGGIVTVLGEPRGCAHQPG